MASEAAVANPAKSAAAVLRDLRRGGYTLSVITRTEVYAHHIGPHPITYGRRLLVKPTPPADLQADIRANRDELLAAACVIDPPVPWLPVVIGRARKKGELFGMLVANIAGFMGKDPTRYDGGLEMIIDQALLMTA